MRVQLFSILAVTFLLMGSFACKQKNSTATKTQTAAEVSKASTESVGYNVVPGQSMVNWEGAKPNKQHIGTINVKSGSFTMKGDAIESGNFVLDMTTIASTDLEGGMKANLEGHLKGLQEGKENDFFNVTQYPEAKFDITKVTKLLNDEDANHLIYGNLTIKDVSKEIGFRAHIRQTGEQIMATSVPFFIDRTEWGIQFMSNKFVDNLKDNFIKDEIGLSVMLVGKKG